MYKVCGKPYEKCKWGAGVNKNLAVFDTVKAKEIVAQLLTNAAGVRYGSVSVSAKLHDGKVVEVSYSRTEHTRDVDVIKVTDK
jgi:hypothetical protein